MPELPEVETVRAGLEPVLTGATVTGIHVLDERSLKRHLAGPHDFVDQRHALGLRSRSRRRL